LAQLALESWRPGSFKLDGGLYRSICNAELRQYLQAADMFGTENAEIAMIECADLSAVQTFRQRHDTAVHKVEE
jgi:hypothetical protein